ncbi:MAG: acetyl-CoA C-acyltransferase, partial [Pseudomonadota bacterium]|nr:acetyl-CoA C-acyltransferase [Pseudomonadota bacterium]
MADAFIYDAIRTPRGKGKQGGSLYEVKPIDLVTNLLEEMKERLNLDTSKVEDLILACGEPVKEQGQNIAKAALVYSSWDDITTGAQLHRFCAGGLDAVNMAAAKVASGFEELVAAGGVESMSRLGIGASGGATGDPWVAMKSYFISQGLGADMIATMDGISREEVDAYAARSQHRAAQARDNGYFKSIVPVRDMNGVVVLEQDELIRAETTAEGLAKLKPAFQMFNDFGHGGVAKLKYPELENIECVHTAGNSSGIVDGAGLVL